jgi:hypothetical protein
MLPAWRQLVQVFEHRDACMLLQVSAVVKAAVQNQIPGPWMKLLARAFCTSLMWMCKGFSQGV